MEIVGARMIKHDTEIWCCNNFYAKFRQCAY